ncbi:hypothetical protein HU200_063985 [Digitaria exilis]|uniref:DUF295 domain-containing protein n=1 Tax=Digitaria exilis TaxID=1010633 RepID=A0A835DZ34_9POAL|nr:hypothetical protein HU200_063985 [Digitaria exilis]
MFTTVAGSINLQRPEVLPHSVAGIFSNYCDDNVSNYCDDNVLYLFARPRGRGPKIDGTFSSIPDGAFSLFDDMYVCNPATRRWAILPPPQNETRYYGSYLNNPECACADEVPPGQTFFGFSPVCRSGFELRRGNVRHRSLHVLVLSCVGPKFVPTHFGDSVGEEET